MTETLKITGLHVSVEGKPILCGVNLTIRLGETHALMGPNGSGKSTLGNAIMGHPGYQVTEGSIELDGENVLEWDATERARAGIFMAFQRPMASVCRFAFTLRKSRAWKMRQRRQRVRRAPTSRDSTY